jgi:ArsR family transcriptional regulator, arsenate/arsenite/antimonite-responsive transcriptional repressor / arsenate reductase (thioredoxin)
VVRTPVRSKGPPPFLKLAGHPVRWRLLSELSRSDRAVRELSALVGEAQSLVSYHLAQLRHGELVRARRSSADGRDSYYALDLLRCRDLLDAAGLALHPGLGHLPARVGVASGPKPQILFLCTGNGARSQIAEALTDHLANGAVEVVSAGSRPKPVHPNAVRVMRERGIDITASRSKHLGEFARRRFDVVITLCDRVREVCPEFRGHPDVWHWSTPDPGLEGSTDDETHPAFQRTATELETRIAFLLRALLPHQEGGRSMDEFVNVRYLVDDVDAAIDFYTKHFGFELISSAAPAFADVRRDNLRLLLSGPKSSAGRPMSDGAVPGPGGWNRIHFMVDDLASEVERLRAEGVTFRNDVVTGPGGQQILIEDPAGNLVELFQPAPR